VRWLYSNILLAVFLLMSVWAFAQPKSSRATVSLLRKEVSVLQKKMQGCPGSPDSVRCGLWAQERLILQQEIAALQVSDSFSGLLLKDVEVKQNRKTPLWLQEVDTIQKQKARFYLLRAEEALERELWLDAHRFINEALSLYPGFYEARLLRADLDARRMDIDAAFRGYSICIALFPDKPSSHYNLGQLYLKMNKLNRAMECFTESINRDRSYVLGYMARASLHMELGKYTDALHDLDAVLTINPRFVFAYKTRGIANLLLKNFTGAIQDFDEYALWTDRDAYVFKQRGLAKVLSGNLVEGCLDFARAEEWGDIQAREMIKKYCR